MTWEQMKEYIAHFRNRGRAYRSVFKLSDKAAQVVLADIMKFCRVNSPLWHPDPRMHAVLVGRHEVALRILQHLNLSDEQLWALYGGDKPLVQLENEVYNA